MKSPQPLIQFHFADLQFTFRKREATRRMILDLILREGKTINHINYVFCSDNYLLQLNQEYLDHDTLTDIITFHYHKKEEPILSDIYISIERVKENAKTFNSSFGREFHRVLFHGALHLCGYKDKTKAAAQQMREKEDFYLNLLFS